MSADPAPTPRTDLERHKTHACYDAVTADCARTLERELTSAQAALAAAKLDTERLDWLEREDGGLVGVTLPGAKMGMTLRAAIDQARKNQ